MSSVSRHINVATVQTLASFLEEPPRDATPDKKSYHLKRRELVKRFLSSVSLLILEEAHESSGSNFYDIARLCVNADYRLALTATPVHEGFYRSQHASDGCGRSN